MGVRRSLVIAVLFALLVAACGDDDDDVARRPAEGGDVEVELLAGPAREAPTAAADPALAGEAITAFGTELFGAVRALPTSDGDNVILSPTSVAIALAMVEPGAVEAGGDALRSVLRIEDPAAFHASMNALEQDLEARVPDPAPDATGDPGELALHVADAAYLQHDFPFEQAYIDAVTTSYGPTLNAVDFTVDPDAVAHEINRFVAGETRDRITELVPDGALSVETVFALVNALYLKASWLHVFDADATADDTFTRLDGSEVTVPLMHGFGDSSARGDGWVAATKSYVGGLTAQFVLPDDGRFDEVAGDLAAVFAAYDADPASGAELVVPRFESRFHVDLPDALRALGLGPLFDRDGQLLGIAPDPRLRLDKAIHETFVAVDEEGTEAAAATVVTGFITSAPSTPPVPVVLDRPFLFRIVDTRTGATLFIGQVLDPS